MTEPAANAAVSATVTVPVWGRTLRLLHLTLVLSVAGAWLTTEWWVGLHQPLGWVAAAVVAVRVAMGFFGRVRPAHHSRYARFTQFIRSPRATLAYAKQWRRHREPRYLGHNPLGGWMVLLLLGWAAALALSGWLYTTDWLWGDATVEWVHVALAWSLLAAVALHVAGVVNASRRHRENLVRAMLDGRKRAPQAGDVS